MKARRPIRGDWDRAIQGLRCCAWLGALALGCGSNESAAPPINIVWMHNGTTSSFFAASENGARLASQNLTTAGGREVRVQISSPAENTGASQVAQIETAVAAKADVLNVDVNDVAVVSPAIDKAVDAGLKVLTFDGDAPNSKRLTYYGIDNEQAGRTSAQLLTKLMGGTAGRIAVMLKEVPVTSSNFAERLQGFQDELAASHPGFTIATILPCTDDVEVVTKAGCSGVLEDAMVSNPDVTGWYLARGRVLRETNLATEAPNWSAKMLSGAFQAVAFDAIPASLDNIKAGYANAVINQKYFGWGYDVVMLSYDILTSNRQVPAFTDSQFDVVCANNVDQEVAMWQKSDFLEPLTPCSLLQP